MKVHLHTSHNPCALTSLLLLPVVAVLAARPDPSAVVLNSAALSLGLRDAALRDLFVRTTTIGLFPPLSVSSSLQLPPESQVLGGRACPGWPLGMI